MTRDEWLDFGMTHGWCGPVVCVMHDGVPTTAAEDAEVEVGDDPCLWVVRIYADDVERNAVEENHPPSLWRKA